MLDGCARSISHQWLGFQTPDPEGLHYKCICAAAHELCERHDIMATELYLWIDYLSIPQRNAQMQKLSISTLPVYASISTFFIVVAPLASTEEKGQVDQTTCVWL